MMVKTLFRFKIRVRVYQLGLVVVVGGGGLLVEASEIFCAVRQEDLDSSLLLDF